MKAKDYLTDQDVRWCPGCGDYSVLKQLTEVFEAIGADPDNTVLISGIGCSSRLPYYINTYGLHGLHGRAPAIATGVKLANPDADVWLVTGDGDALSIGGNHLIHLLRRNVNVPILLFNNEVYGLTKGQYSPTSQPGQHSRSSPLGSIDQALNPLTLAMGANASFIARSMDRSPAHLREMMIAAKAHHGSALLEIYQNCNVFNDGAFARFSNKQHAIDHTFHVEHGKPILIGKDQDKTLQLVQGQVEVIKLSPAGDVSQAWIHDIHDPIKAYALARMVGDLRPFGIIYQCERPVHEQEVHRAMAEQGQKSLEAILHAGRTWEV